MQTVFGSNEGRPRDRCCKQSTVDALSFMNASGNPRGSNRFDETTTRGIATFLVRSDSTRLRGWRHLKLEDVGPRCQQATVHVRQEKELWKKVTKDRSTRSATLAETVGISMFLCLETKVTPSVSRVVQERSRSKVARGRSWNLQKGGKGSLASEHNVVKGASKGCCLVGFEYLKASKRHPFEPPGSKNMQYRSCKAFGLT